MLQPDGRIGTEFFAVEDAREATEAEIGAGSAGTGFFRIQPLHSDLAGNSTLH